MSSWLQPLLIQLSATGNQMHSWYKSQHSQYFISVWHITFFKILSYPWPRSILPTILKGNSAITIISHFTNIETRVLRELVLCEKTKRNKIKTDSRLFTLVHGKLWSPGQTVNWQTKNAFAFLNGWGGKKWKNSNILWHKKITWNFKC